MRSHKFLAGIVTGVALVVLVTGLLLAGVGRQPTNAAGSTPVANASAKATPAATGTLTAQPDNNVSQLEQRMINPISDAEWNAAATALGINEADFVAAIKTGQSVAVLGAPHQVSADQVRSAMIAAGTAVVSAAVQDNTITQAESNVLDHGMVTAIADKVTHANTGDSTTGPGTPAGDEKALDAQKRAAAGSAPAINNTIAAAEISAMASTLGISLNEIKPALDNPAELATLAASHHINAQQLQEALVTAGRQALDQAVASGTVSQSDADGLGTSLVQLMAEKLSHIVDVVATPVP